MSNPVRVLSIDGGGMRGLIPAMVLTEIEERAGKPVCELFDLVAGTSTGGILALGLTKPDGDDKPAYSAADLTELYIEEGQRIFSRSPWDRFRALENLLEEKYPSEGIDAVLTDYFGDTALSEALTKVLVTSYEIERRIAFLFKSHRARQEEENDFPMRLVARATSAAPTYFEPVRIPVAGPEEYYALVDGGVYANNPGMCAYVEARSVFSDRDDFLVVSLGTGTLTRPLPYDEAKGWGLARWAQPILDVVFDGVSDTVDYQLQQLCRKHEDVKRYFRFQVRLDEGRDDMDDASKTNLRALRLLAEGLIREKDEELNDVCKQLAAASP
jgi:patatin-like phospholipase/acyl hydrolase